MRSAEKQEANRVPTIFDYPFKKLVNVGYDEYTDGLLIDTKFDGFPQSGRFGREGYLGSEMGIPNEDSGSYPIQRFLDNYNRFNPKLNFFKESMLGFYPSAPNYENTKSAGIETAIKELKDLFCNSFKRK